MLQKLNPETLRELLNETSPISYQEIQDHLDITPYTDIQLKTIKAFLKEEIEKFSDYKEAEKLLDMIEGYLNK